MIYAVDFDGTLCVEARPFIGEPKQRVIDFCRRKQSEGHNLILWTCREGKMLSNAVRWCAERGLFFDAINQNIPDMVQKWNNDCRKVGADYYIDDKAIKPEEI